MQKFESRIKILAVFAGFLLFPVYSFAQIKQETAKKLTESENVTNVIDPALLNKILVISIIVFVIAFLLLLLFSLIHRQVLKWETAYRKENIGRLEQFLAVYISNEAYLSAENKDLFLQEPYNLTLKDFSNKKNLAFMKENITALYQMLEGEEAEKLKELYLFFEFEKQAFKNTKSYLMVKAVPAIRELRNMNISYLFSDIYKLIDHKNPHIALEAMLLWIQSQEEPFSFLEKIHQPLSVWQQAQLLDAAIKLPYEKQPDFSKWVHHTNESVISLSLKCIFYLNQPIEKEILLTLADSKNGEIKGMATRNLVEIYG